MKFAKGDKVCALLVNNKWGVEYTCFVGELEKVEKTSYGTIAHIQVTKSISLYDKKEYPASLFRLDAKLFKILPWNDTTKLKLKTLREASKVLDKLTREIKNG